MLAALCWNEHPMLMQGVPQYHLVYHLQPSSSLGHLSPPRMMIRDMEGKKGMINRQSFPRFRAMVS
jgi:hypothetical protein